MRSCLNKDKRKRLEEAVGLLEQAQGIIEEVKDEEQAALKAKAEEMVEVRKTYKVYLDGEEVSYNSVLFSNYDCTIDDSAHAIYLTM